MKVPIPINISLDYMDYINYYTYFLETKSGESLKCFRGTTHCRGPVCNLKRF